MALTTEVLIFEASDDFRNDPKIAIPAFDIVLKAGGVHAPAYYGKQVEEPTTGPGYGYVFLNWNNYEAHKAVIDGGSHPSILGALKPSLGGKVEMYHVKFSAPPTALEKPVTEVAVLTLKEPGSRAAVVEILSQFSEAGKKTVVFGQTREDENKYVIVGGWPTVEAHQEAAARPKVAAALDKLSPLVNKNHLYHTKLSQYRL